MVRPTGSGSAAQKLGMNDALSYLKKARWILPQDKYDDLLQVLKDMKAGRTDTSGVTTRVKALMDGHPVLIRGFNAFLPKGYEIDPPPPPPRPEVEQQRRQQFDEAVDLVDRVKTRFAGDRGVYHSFLDILNTYRKNHKTMAQVYEEVAALFKDHQDLLQDFVRFLPDDGNFGAEHQVGEGDDGKSGCERLLDCLDATKCKCKHLK
ncbi:unnamed protein product [Linum tenue]|uniref:Uncharacterized protein n=1 Tax=Linum tenue TaxID=586396 RepID=A0AAV0HMW1_9ROSI|nr:unnamed protein product [Linum tenue]